MEPCCGEGGASSAVPWPTRVGAANLILEVSVAEPRLGVLAPVVHKQSIAFPLGSGSFSEAHLDLASADLMHIANVLQRSPDEVLKAANLLSNGHLEEASRVATEAGLDEEEFRKAGGGWFGLVVLAVVAALSLKSCKAPPPPKEQAQSFKIKQENLQYFDGLKKQ